MLTSVCSELEVALADIFQVVLSFNLVLFHVAKIMLRKFVLVAGLVVHGVSAEVVVGLSVLGDALLLGQERRLMVLTNAVKSCLIKEESVVLVRSRPVIRYLLESHFEVGDSHGAGIADVSHLLEREFLRSVGMAS